MCLYRTGPESPIPPALIRASEQGKQVTALIEAEGKVRRVSTTSSGRESLNAQAFTLFTALLDSRRTAS
jgi:hypothetical protein